MRRLYDEGLCHREVGERLGRSRASVGNRAWALGLCSAVPVGHPPTWSEADIAELSRLCASGLRYVDIAEKIGRTYSAVAQRAWALGINQRNRKAA